MSPWRAIDKFLDFSKKLTLFMTNFFNKLLESIIILLGSRVKKQITDTRDFFTADL